MVQRLIGSSISPVCVFAKQTKLLLSHVSVCLIFDPEKCHIIKKKKYIVWNYFTFPSEMYIKKYKHKPRLILTQIFRHFFLRVMTLLMLLTYDLSQVERLVIGQVQINSSYIPVPCLEGFFAKETRRMQLLSLATRGHSVQQIVYR